MTDSSLGADTLKGFYSATSLHSIFREAFVLYLLHAKTQVNVSVKIKDNNCGSV